MAAVLLEPCDTSSRARQQVVPADNTLGCCPSVFISRATQLSGALPAADVFSAQHSAGESKEYHPRVASQPEGSRRKRAAGPSGRGELFSSSPGQEPRSSSCRPSAGTDSGSAVMVAHDRPGSQRATSSSDKRIGDESNAANIDQPAVAVQTRKSCLARTGVEHERKR